MAKKPNAKKADKNGVTAAAKSAEADTALEFTDDHVGRLVDSRDELGIRDDTVIIDDDSHLITPEQHLEIAMARQ